MPENRDSENTGRSPLLWVVAGCVAVGAAGYLHGFAQGKREGLVTAPEYVAERLAIDRIEAQARLEAAGRAPADRYEMCDAIMDMTADMLLLEEAEAQRRMDEHAREAEGEIDYR